MNRKILTLIILSLFLYMVGAFLCSLFEISLTTKIHAVVVITAILVCAALSPLCRTDIFKGLKNQPKTDTLFIGILFIILFIPMSHIDKNMFTENEERRLEPYPKLLTENHHINFNYSNEFDKWYSDRFKLRSKLIYINRSILFYLNKRYVKYANDQIADKKENILYSGWETYEIANDTLMESFSTLAKFNNYCNRRHIKLYTLIVPSKTIIYQPEPILKKNDTNLRNTLRRCSRQYLKILYPYSGIKAASKQQYTYYKTDHHWTEDGAFIAYKALMRDITKDFPDVKPLDYKDFYITETKYVNADWDGDDKLGHTCKYMSLPDSICKKFLDVNYRKFTHPNAAELKQTVIDKPLIKQKDFYYPDGADYRVIILGTSMGEQLTKFIPYNFKNTRRIRTNNVIGLKSGEEFKILKNNQKQIFDYHPDIIILCVAYYNVAAFKDIFKRN